MTNERAPNSDREIPFCKSDKPIYRNIFRTFYGNLEAVSPQKMKYALLVAFVFGASICSGQTLHKSTYVYVDSLIVNVLQYNQESAPVQPEVRRKKTGLDRSVSSLPRNPEPLIILDGVPVPKDDLKTIKFKKIGSIRASPPNSELAAIFGIRSSNGVIIITTKKYQKLNEIK